MTLSMRIAEDVLSDKSERRRSRRDSSERISWTLAGNVPTLIVGSHMQRCRGIVDGLRLEWQEERACICVFFHSPCTM